MNVIQCQDTFHTVAFPSSSQRSYAVTSRFPPGKTRPRSYRRNDRADKRYGTNSMQHAALINIVAAVNVDFHGHSFMKRGHNHDQSDKEVEHEFIIPRSTAISIPQPKQRVFNLPEEIVQRKPVYYKNSPDLEVRGETKFRYTSGVNGCDIDSKQDKSSKTNKQPLDSSLKFPAKNLSTSSYSATSRSTLKRASSEERSLRSGVRRLGDCCAKQKADTKLVCELPKCEAVDLLETSKGHEDPAKSALDNSRKIIPANNHAPIPYIRTKSLPAIFPTKTSRQSSRPDSAIPQTPKSIIKGRPLSENKRKRELVSAKASPIRLSEVIGPLLINNVSSRPAAEVYHRNQIPLQRHETASCSRSTMHSSGRTTFHSPNLVRTSFDLPLDRRRPLTSGHRAMSGKSTNSTPLSEKTNTSGLSTRSFLTSYTNTTESLTSERQNVKKVQFASNTYCKQKGSLKHDPGNVVGERPCPGSHYNSPVSSQEVILMQQKILPVNLPKENIRKNFYLPASGITIQRLQRSKTEMTPGRSRYKHYSFKEEKNEEIKSNSRLNADVRTECRTEVINTADKPPEYDKGEEETDDLDSSEDNSSDDEGKRMHESIPTLSLCKNDTVQYYRLFKAVDLHSYDGYEHKKLRKSAGSSRLKDSGAQKSYYVKVRLS